MKNEGKKNSEVRVPRNTNEPKLNEGSFLICAIDSVARCRKAKLLFSKRMIPIDRARRSLSVAGAHKFPITRNK